MHILKYWEEIVKRAKEYLPNKDLEETLNRAFLFAKKAHDTQFRFTGEPYLIHPVKSTLILMDLTPDLETIIACLLHDTTEDNEKLTLEDIEKEFDKNVAMLVSGMEKLEKIKYRGEERTIGSLRKMFLAMAGDLRVIFIKIVERLHNMQTLKFHERKDKIDRIAQETLHIFVPIAERLGMYALKDSLQEECFKYLYPQDYKYITEQLEIQGKKKQDLIDNSKLKLEKLMNKYSIKAQIYGRLKKPYSIFKKLKTKNINDIYDIYDIFALRIIVDNKPLCYTVLGYIHEEFRPISHRFKDYIAMPKPNHYKSLHTTVLDLIKKQPVEIQIRTKQMHLEAQFGISAQYFYKEHGSGKENYEINWVKELAEITKSYQDYNEFLDSVKMDIFSYRIFVLTPKGDIKDLPEGATPIDFAYAVHTDIGHSFNGAKVNGSIVNLNYKLQSGDVVEILRKNIPKPNPFWLNIVKMSSTKNKIRAWLKNDVKTNSLQEGIKIFNFYLQKMHKQVLDKKFSILKEWNEKCMTKISERKKVLEQIGDGSLSPIKVINTIFRIDERIKPKNTIKHESVKHEIIVDGQKGINYKIALCCNPVYTDDIIGYITKNGEISVHNKRCKVLKTLNFEKFINVLWENQTEQFYKLDLEIFVVDQVGVLNTIVNIITELNLNIFNVSVARENEDVKLIITLKTNNFGIIIKLVHLLEDLDFVNKVQINY